MAKLLSVRIQLAWGRTFGISGGFNLSQTQHALLSLWDPTENAHFDMWMYPLLLAYSSLGAFLPDPALSEARAKLPSVRNQLAGGRTFGISARVSFSQTLPVDCVFKRVHG